MNARWLIACFIAGLLFDPICSRITRYLNEPIKFGMVCDIGGTSIEVASKTNGTYPPETLWICHIIFEDGSIERHEASSWDISGGWFLKNRLGKIVKLNGQCGIPDERIKRICLLKLSYLKHKDQKQ